MTSTPRPIERGSRWALGTLLLLTSITAAWWALALWPTPDSPPAWLSRARLVCFDAGPDGLPGPAGWLLLIGQPLGMFGILVIVWGGPLRSGLRALGRRTWGRVLLATFCLGLTLGAAAAAIRVRDTLASREPFTSIESPLPDTYPRLDREAPALSLVDQHGERIDVTALRGRTALVTFAFGDCETVCPAVVRQALEARDIIRDGDAAHESVVPRVVIVSLDPWRDTPSRLPHLAEHWQLDGDAHVLSGSVEAVERVLDAWQVARQRNEQTGDVVHPPLVYVVDERGRIAFASTGGVTALVELLNRTSNEKSRASALARRNS